MVPHRDDHRRWDVDVADPGPGREAPDRAPGLEDLRPVVTAHLTHGPRVVLPGPPSQVDAGEPIPEHTRREAGGPGQRSHAGEHQPLVPRGREGGGGGAQHQTLDPLGMAVPDELGDGPTHRVADRDDPVDPELVGQRHGVVGAVAQAEGTGGRDAATVAAMVEREHPEAAAQRLEAGEPVEVGGGRPTVQEYERGRPYRPGHLADERRATSRQVDGAPRGERGGHDGLVGHLEAQRRLSRNRIVARPQPISALTMTTRRTPPGASYSTSSPACFPMSAAPRGEVGEITSCSTLLLDVADQVRLGHVLVVTLVADGDDGPGRDHAFHRFVDDLHVLQDGLERPDAGLHVALLVLGSVVVAVLGQVAHLARPFDGLRDLDAASGREVVVLGL